MAAPHIKSITKTFSFFLMMILIAINLLQALIILCLEHCKKGYNWPDNFFLPHCA